MDSWAKDWIENTYWFGEMSVKQVPSFPASMAKQWVHTNCSDTYMSGLLCKNARMVQMFQQAEYKHYKWILRVVDDTFVHVENAWDYLSALNASKPQLIGERYCHPQFSYPTGGAGFAISRGLIDDFDMDTWRRITSREDRREFVFDDLVWGQLVQAMHVPFIHHPGFSQFQASAGSPMFHYLLNRQTSWDLPFRPIAYHQGPNRLDLMPHLDDVLHRLPYDVKAESILPAAECKCFHVEHDAHEYRCAPSEHLIQRKECGAGFKWLYCLTGNK